MEGARTLLPPGRVPRIMTHIVCPKCDATIEAPRTFEEHMATDHPGVPASLGFGHTRF